MPKAVGNLKVCSTCKVEKGVGSYHKSRVRPDGLHSDCKECTREANARWRAANPEKKRAQKRYDRAHDLMRLYGITVEQYDEMFMAQQGRCLICDQASTKRLAVDHCHTTGAIRGLLCSPCNLGLGNFRDNPDLLVAAIKYLQASA